MAQYKLLTKIEFGAGLEPIQMEKYLAAKPTKVILTLETEQPNAPTIVVIGTKEIVVP